MVASRRPQAIRPPDVPFEFEVEIVDQVYKYSLDFVCSEKSTRARMDAIAKVQVVRPASRELVLGLVPGKIPKLLESEAVKLAWVLPKILVIRNLVQGESDVHSWLQHSPVVESDGLDDLPPHVQQRYWAEPMGLFEERVQLAQLWHRSLSEVRR